MAKILSIEEEERFAAEEHARHLAGLENVRRAKEEFLAKQEKEHLAKVKRQEEERLAAEEHARHLAGLENVKRAKEILAKREKAEQ